MAQGQKKFSKNVSAKASKKHKHKPSKNPAPRVGRVKAPRRALAVKANKLKAELTRNLGQKIEQEVARQAVSSDINLRIVSTGQVPEKSTQQAAAAKKPIVTAVHVKKG